MMSQQLPEFIITVRSKGECAVKIFCNGKLVDKTDQITEGTIVVTNDTVMYRYAYKVCPR
jgi:hypothetical protein